MTDHIPNDVKYAFITIIKESLTNIEKHSNKEIAANLYLSEGTVRNYLSTILDKLGLRDRTQLAIFIINIIKRLYYTKHFLKFSVTKSFHGNI